MLIKLCYSDFHDELVYVPSDAKINSKDIIRALGGFVEGTSPIDHLRRRRCDASLKRIKNVSIDLHIRDLHDWQGILPSFQYLTEKCQERKIYLKQTLRLTKMQRNGSLQVREAAIMRPLIDSYLCNEAVVAIDEALRHPQGLDLAEAKLALAELAQHTAAAIDEAITRCSREPLQERVHSATASIEAFTAGLRSLKATAIS